MQRSPTHGALPISALMWLAVSACSNGQHPDDAASTSSAATGGSSAGNAAGASGSSGRAPAAMSAGSAASSQNAGAAGSSAAAAGASGSAGGAPAESGASGSSEPSTPGTDAGTVDAEAPTDARPPATSLMLPVTMESGGVEPWFNVYRPTDLSATGQPLPVIVWANGGCLRVDFAWATLLNRWAAAGFVVIALTESPSDGLFGQTTVQDQGKLVDWALEQAEKADSPYAGKLDTTRIVAAGNSCGGVTALGLAATDDRIAAVFVLSGSSAIGAADEKVMNAITVPVGYVVGNPDEDIAAPNAIMDYGLIPDGVPGMIVTRSTGDHLTVSSDEAVQKDDAEIALSWMDLALYGTKEAADALTSPNVCAGCEPGTWTLKSKNLEKLQR